jgi:hypothetical protein
LWKKNLLTVPGHYIFIESSAPRCQGDNAILQSAMLSAATNCIQFWYNMYGTNIGTLNVWVRPQNGAGTIVWSLSGNKGATWKQGSVIVGQNTPYQVMAHDHKTKAGDQTQISSIWLAEMATSPALV